MCFKLAYRRARERPPSESAPTMTPPPNPEYSHASLWMFEQKHHGPVIDWMWEKFDVKPENADILDFSLDAVTYSVLVSEKFPGSTLTAAFRPGCYPPCSAKVKVIENIDLTGDDFPTVASLGKFDVIVLKEMLHEIRPEVLPKFMKDLSTNLKGPESRIFILSRPKNPPIPLPDEAMTLWRKYAPTRDEIIKAGAEAGYVQDSYCCSAPILIDKREWGNILKGRFLPVMKGNKKVSDRNINEFVQCYQSGKNLKFEEKVLIFVLREKKEGEEVNPDGTLKGAQAFAGDEKARAMYGI